MSFQARMVTFHRGYFVTGLGSLRVVGAERAPIIYRETFLRRGFAGMEKPLGVRGFCICNRFIL